MSVPPLVEFTRNGQKVPSRPRRASSPRRAVFRSTASRILPWLQAGVWMHKPYGKPYRAKLATCLKAANRPRRRLGMGVCAGL